MGRRNLNTTQRAALASEYKRLIMVMVRQYKAQKARAQWQDGKFGPTVENSLESPEVAARTQSISATPQKCTAYFTHITAFIFTAIFACKMSIGTYAAPPYLFHISAHITFSFCHIFCSPHLFLTSIYIKAQSSITSLYISVFPSIV